jgi:protein TonB
MNVALNLANQNRHPFQKYEIYLFAFIAEVLILGGLLFFIFGHFKTTPPNNDVISLVLNEIPAEKPTEPEKPKTIPTKVIKEPINKTPVKTPTPVKVNTPPLPKSSAPSETPTQQPNKSSEASPAVASPATAQAVSRSENRPDPMAQYQGQVRAAIQNAAICTSAAKEMNASGKTRVQFNLKDALPSGAHIVSGSGIPFLDNSAISAVQNARYPRPPEEFIGENKLMTVLVVLNCSN